MTGRRGLTFVIAQRMSTVRRADRTIVMENRSIEEEGRHAELLGRDGGYCKLFAEQLYDVPGVPALGS